MNTIRLLKALTLAVAVTLVSCTPSPDLSPRGLRVMTFNIEYGGNYTDFAEVVAAVKLADPDVVALSEGYSSVGKLASALGWKFWDHGMQVVSKYPLLEPQDSQGTFLYVELSPGAAVALSNLHLDSDPYGPDLLAAGSSDQDVLTMEQQTHLKQLEPHWSVWAGLSRSVPVILTGDFNTPSHLDWVKKPFAWPVSKKLEGLGFQDSYRVVHPDPVATPGITWFAGRPQYSDHWNPEPDAAMERIDYIYAAGAVKVIDSQLVGEEGSPLVQLTKPGVWPSDHRAVVSTFQVTPSPLPAIVAVSSRLLRAGETLEVSLKGIVGAVELVAEGEMPRGKTSPAQGPKFDTSKLTPGVYSAVVRAPDGALVTSRPFEVLAADAQPFVTVDKAEYRQAESLQVSFGNSTACRWDWVAVYGEGESPSTTPDNYWVYDYASNGHSTGTLVPRAAGTLTLPCADLEPGTYRAWLITNEYDALAQSAVFKVE